MIDNQGETEGTEIERSTYPTSDPITETPWFEKPFGLFLIGLFVAVVGCGIARYLGWY